MRTLIAVAALALLFPRLAVARVYDWRPVNQQAATLLESGDFDAAAPVIADGLAQCPQAVSPLESALCTAIFTENQAVLQEHRGDLAAAETSLRTFLETRAAVLPPADPLIEQAHVVLARFYQRYGRRAEEITELQAAEAIVRAAGPSRRSDLADLLTRHAYALTALMRPQDALSFYRQAYALSLQANGLAARDTLLMLGNLFTAEIAVGQADTAIDTLQTVLGRPDSDSFDPTQRAMLAGKLALETTSLPRSRAALGFVTTALPDLDNGLVTDPDTRFTLLRGAARLLAGLGDPAQAVTLAQKARTVAIAAYGPASVAVSNALRTEAEAEIALHNPTEAVARLTEAAAILDTPGLDVPGLLLARVQLEAQIATALTSAGQREEAVRRIVALADSARVTGAEPATRAAALTRLGTDLIPLEAYEPAQRICARATALDAAQPSLDDRLKARLCAGNALIGLGKPADAFTVAAGTEAALWATGAEPNPRQQIDVADLRARALHESHRDAEAIQAYRAELALYRRLNDTGGQATSWVQIAVLQRLSGLLRDSEESTNTGLALLAEPGFDRARANLLANRAQLLQAAGRVADSVPVLETVLKLRRADPAPEDLAIAATQRDLALALSAVGRNRAAGVHMDLAIEGFRALGPARKPLLINALERRASIAVAAGEPKRAIEAERARLALDNPDSDAAAATALTLADLLDNQAQHAEAASLRTDALALVAVRHGAASLETIRARMMTLASLRATAQLAAAEAIGQDCITLSATVTALRFSCLIAQAETAVSAGAVLDAAALGARAVTEAETHWSEGANLSQALTLQARAEAQLGHIDTVLRLFDRIHAITPRQGNGPAWTDYAEGELLLQAGATELGPAFLRLALARALRTQDANLAVTTTRALSELAVAHGEPAVALWEAVQPLAAKAAPSVRVTVLEGFGTAAAATGRFGDAAQFLSAAASISRQANGAGAPVTLQLMVAQAEALDRAGAAGLADSVILALAQDPSPLAQRLLTRAALQNALESDDPVAGLMLAREAAVQAANLFGPGSVGGRVGHLDLIEAELAVHRPVSKQDVLASLAALQRLDPSWRTSYRAARILGSLAAASGWFDVAAEAYDQAETLVTANQGPGTLEAATQHANRAGAVLQAGNTETADRLFQEALAMAAPAGHDRNPTWGHIAIAAATAAERIGDLRRANQLRHDAEALVPAAAPRITLRWG